MDYWQKRKLKKWIIFGVLVFAAILCIRELLQVHAYAVTIKYVEDAETYRSSRGYTWAVSSRDQEDIREWADLMQEIRWKGDKMDSGTLDRPFPCYMVEFRIKKGAWVAMMQVTENRVGCAYQLLGGDVFDFGSDSSFYERVGKMTKKMR